MSGRPRPGRRRHLVPPAAIIKIGSTSSTLLVAERLSQPLVRDQRLFNLFEAEGQRALLGQVADWRRVARDYGSEPIGAGGEAVRQCAALADALRSLLADWWDLSGDAEGRLAWMAVSAEDAHTDGVLDIGGGSTEIVTRTGVASLPWGAAHQAPHMDWPELPTLTNPAAVGGTVSALAAWCGRDRVSRKDARALADALETNPGQFESLDPLRRRILPGGLAVLESLWDRTGWPWLRISRRGLTEGLWLAASLGRGVQP